MYATQTDILEQLPEADLIALTDDAGLGAVDESVVARALADAEALIDSYCQGRYPVPLSPAPPAIRRIAVDMAIYHLFARRSMDCPKIRDDRQREAIRFLEKVAEGKIMLGAATPAPTDAGAAIVSAPDRLFTRDLLRGM